MSRRVRGTVVSEGLARGEALVVATGEVSVPEGHVSEHQVEREVQRFRRAVEGARTEIAREEKAARERLGEMSEIIGWYLTILADETTLLQPIEAMMRRERFTAKYATFRRFSEVAAQFEGAGEPMASRVPDIIDVKRRLIAHLRGGRKPLGELERLQRKVVIIADDLTPSQAASLDREKVLAFATDRGGPAGHTAILARHLGIPAIVGLDNVTSMVRSGEPVIIDGLSRGEVIVDPNQDDVHEYQVLSRRLQARRRRVHLDQERALTKDDVPITILGNIDRGEQVGGLRELGVEGVGLFRTEFLFLGNTAPDEEAQREHYGRLLRDMAPHSVCIRTMDFGADKWDHRVGGGKEPNPFLGMRAIRLSFAHEGLFRAQLRAILRASLEGRCQIMFPMISDAAEFRRAVGVLDSVKDELRKEGIPFDERVEVGAMIEVPSAALTVENILADADFVSLGTNDLTQYTLAVDRTNPLVAEMFVPHHPAVLRLMQRTVAACEVQGKRVSACGEMAGVAEYAPVVLGLGLTRLSMAARRVPDVVTRIRKLSREACRGVVEAMMAADGAAAAHKILTQFNRPPTSRRRQTR
ncbi:MAG: phosphoenolpyruvate--protein phosphotransferase [Planctomycetes bacterium]|nr:phosphoenolpyruvate--protein phosphotransferase [Planctomycetota bacterium]